MQVTGGFITAAPDKKPAKTTVASKKAPLPTRRQSFSHPQTIESSTKINAEKAHRRLSSRFSSGSHGKGAKSQARDQTSISSSACSLSENRPPAYSPPLTRSGKKKQLSQPNSTAVFSKNGVLLEFSPPDQRENERREREKVKLAEQERYVIRLSHVQLNHFVPLNVVLLQPKGYDAFREHE